MAAPDRTVSPFSCPPERHRRRPISREPVAGVVSARALSVKQPWAWAIVHAGKMTENRTWPTKYRGPLFIHAGQREDPEGWATLEAMELELPLHVETGGIVGVVDLIDCVQDHPSVWAVPGHWHWVLANPRRLPFQSMPGRLGIFHVPADRPFAVAA
jgi:hypothetical protein